MFNFSIKNVPIKFVTLGGVDLEAVDVVRVLEEFLEEDDINNYNLNCKVADALVAEGILEKCDGSRNATLYRITSNFYKFNKDFRTEYYECQ